MHAPQHYHIGSGRFCAVVVTNEKVPIRRYKTRLLHRRLPAKFRDTWLNYLLLNYERKKLVHSRKSFTYLLRTQKVYSFTRGSPRCTAPLRVELSLQLHKNTRFQYSTDRLPIFFCHKLSPRSPPAPAPRRACFAPARHRLFVLRCSIEPADS